MSVNFLDCPCGMRLKTPNAVPGRVGKCPRCGTLLKVPEPAPPTDPAPRSESRPTFVDRRVNKRSKKASPVAGGILAAPRRLENSWRESLRYPLQGDASLAVLVFMPAGLWFATVPLFGLVPGFISGNGLSLLAMIFLIPFLLLLGVVGGHTLEFLGQVLVSSSIGEIFPPRQSSWVFAEIGSTLARWFWALLVGVVVGGAPTVVYWINCGEVDWLDRIVIIDLLIPGLAYAQMALLATLLYESPLAANPITVIQAIWRVGWPYWKPCVMSGTALMLVAMLFQGLMRIKDPLGQAVAFWVFWVMILYASMVVLRQLGLFCHENEVVLGWFPERNRAARPAED